MLAKGRLDKEIQNGLANSKLALELGPSKKRKKWVTGFRKKEA